MSDLRKKMVDDIITWPEEQIIRVATNLGIKDAADFLMDDPYDLVMEMVALMIKRRVQEYTRDLL